MFLKRWLTALPLLPLLVLLIFKGGSLLLFLVVCAASLLGLWEYFRIVFKNTTDTFHRSIALIAYCISPLLVWQVSVSAFEVVAVLIILNLILVGITAVIHFKSDPAVLDGVYRQVLGILYIPLFLSCLLVIRSGENGPAWVFCILGAIFLGDTFALYTGTYFGKHKLCPAVSPNKTIEGALGGLAGNLVFGSIAKFFLLPSAPWGASLLFFIIIGISGQIGDLFESAMKRASGVKDSGGILPGHGGILDRIDALIFASPVAFFILKTLLDQSPL